jgi:hypothetical protein
VGRRYRPRLLEMRETLASACIWSNPVNYVVHIGAACGRLLICQLLVRFVIYSCAIGARLQLLSNPIHSGAATSPLLHGEAADLPTSATHDPCLTTAQKVVAPRCRARCFPDRSSRTLGTKNQSGAPGLIQAVSVTSQASCGIRFIRYNAIGFL